MSAPVLLIDQLTFQWPNATDCVLDIEKWSINAGERVFLKGPSGSGKTTLLSLIAGIHPLQKGEITVLGQEMSKLKASSRDRYRADHLGYIFQQFNLIPYLSVMENITLPCRFSKERARRAEQRDGSVEASARRLLSGLELTDEVLVRPVVDLSVGQQQRVAVARALIGEPEFIIADEPTSALDMDTRDHFLSLLLEQCQQNRQTAVLFVSHDQSAEHLFDRSVDLMTLNRAQAEGAG